MSQIQEVRKMRESKSGRRAARRRQAAVRLETLECRQLMSAVVSTTGVMGGLDMRGAVYSGSTLYLSVVDSEAGAQIDKVGPGNTLTPIYTDADASEFDALVAGPGGKLYFVNQATNTIMKFDPLAVTTVSPLYGLPTGTGQDIIGLTVSGADVWFFTKTDTDGTDYGLKNRIGRVDPAGNPTMVTLSGDAVLQYTQIAALSSVHFNDVNADGVYVAFQGVDNTVNNQGSGAPIGRSAVGAAYMSGASLVVTYAQLPTDGGLYQYGDLTGIATDPTDGSVWFALGSGEASDKLVHPASTIVNGTLNAAHNGFVTGTLSPYTVTGAVADNNLRIQSLAFDGAGDLYFVETNAAKVGMLDTNLSTFSDAVLQNLGAETTTQPFVVAVNPTLPTTLSDVAATVIAKTGYTWSSVAATITPATVIFDGSAGVAAHLNEDHLYTAIPIAAFTAPTGNYVAIINWGDGTPPVTVAAQLLNPNVPNVYVVYVNKSFAKQSGTTANPTAGFAGTVTIHETSNAQPDHVLTMTTFVDDTPLTITQFSITTLLQRISTLTMTFRDDVDSKINNFDASINWGDGSTSKGAVLKDPFTPGQYFVLAIHVYKKKGTYTVTATLTGNEEGLLETATQSKTIVLT